MRWPDPFLSISFTFPSNNLVGFKNYLVSLEIFVVHSVLQYMYILSSNKYTLLYWLYVNVPGRGEWIGRFTVSKGAGRREEKSQGAASENGQYQFHERWRLWCWFRCSSPLETTKVRLFCFQDDIALVICMIVIMLVGFTFPGSFHNFLSFAGDLCCGLCEGIPWQRNVTF